MLDARGRPRIKSVPTRWFAVRPSRLVVAPHGIAQLRLTVRRPSGAGPGDHAELLLLSTEPAFETPRGYQVARLRGVGHFMFWEDPEQCLQAIAAFMAG